MNMLPTKEEMERATLARDASYDGIFIVAVRTTRIFCRPSCPARKPLPRNIEYYASPREALLGGYRPCKRCRPMDTNGQPPEWVDQLLIHVDQHPTKRLTDQDLRALSIDPARARRYFRSHYDMTFQAYHRARRMGLALAELRRGADMLDVGFRYGFESSSGFRDAFKQVFGEPPGRGRCANCIVTASIEGPLGRLVAGATENGICLLEFADRRAFESQLTTLRRRLDRAIVPGTNDHLENLKDQLARYFAGTLVEFTVPLVSPGTPFQERVWAELQRIPYGETISYEKLAHAVGTPNACRAVGRANGDNRLAIVIPCHRVVQKNGELRGYGGGLWRKQFLLDLERKTKAAASSISKTTAHAVS